MRLESPLELEIDSNENLNTKTSFRKPPSYEDQIAFPFPESNRQSRKNIDTDALASDITTSLKNVVLTTNKSSSKSHQGSLSLMDIKQKYFCDVVNASIEGPIALMNPEDVMVEWIYPRLGPTNLSATELDWSKTQLLSSPANQNATYLAWRHQFLQDMIAHNYIQSEVQAETSDSNAITLRDVERMEALRSQEIADRMDSRLRTPLDYAGTGVPMKSLIQYYKDSLLEEHFGNGHSENLSSMRGQQAMSQARKQVCNFFKTSLDSHTVAFTAGSTKALSLFGTQYQWRVSEGGVQDTKVKYLFILGDAHNSVNGLRIYANKVFHNNLDKEHPDFEIKCIQIPVDPETLRLDPDCFVATLEHYGRLAHDEWAALAPESRVPISEFRAGVVMYTAQSNVSGIKHPLSLLEEAWKRHFVTVVDAAAYVPTNEIDLQACYWIDFMVVSWNKVLGVPTGLGSIVMSTHAESYLSGLFEGGTVRWVNDSYVDSFRSQAGVESLEGGTPNLTSFVALTKGLEILSENLNGQLTQSLHNVTTMQVRMFTHWTMQQLSNLRWSETQHPLIRVSGLFGKTDNITQADTSDRGGTLTMTFYDSLGKQMDQNFVLFILLIHGIDARNGCMCNMVIRPLNPGTLPLPKACFSKDIDEEERQLADKILDHDPFVNKSYQWDFDAKVWSLKDLPKICPGDCSTRLEPGAVRISMGVNTIFKDLYVLVQLFRRLIMAPELMKEVQTKYSGYVQRKRNATSFKTLSMRQKRKADTIRSRARLQYEASTAWMCDELNSSKINGEICLPLSYSKN